MTSDLRDLRHLLEYRPFPLCPRTSCTDSPRHRLWKWQKLLEPSNRAQCRLVIVPRNPHLRGVDERDVSAVAVALRLVASLWVVGPPVLLPCVDVCLQRLSTVVVVRSCRFAMFCVTSKYRQNARNEIQSACAVASSIALNLSARSSCMRCVAKQVVNITCDMRCLG